MSAEHRRTRACRGTTVPPRWNTGVLDNGVSTDVSTGPCTAWRERTSYQTPSGRYTEVVVCPGDATGLTSNASPTRNWSSMPNVRSSSGQCNHSGRITGAPVRCECSNSVYHSGSSAYRSSTAARVRRRVSSPNSHGSRRLVWMCACARKKGWYAPAWYQRTRSSVSGFPKKPPTSAPAMGKPASETESSMGVEAARWLHWAALSPVQMAPWR
mmetsp:Transcript_8836/g.27860  ORF Transcript_8836/g.27860 Transcript_8836/m.27860 type:complete len:213 (-) Transcript_8836:1808-2446(-)